jgi:hypothetical protein
MTALWHFPVFLTMIGDAMAYLGTFVGTVRRTHRGFGQSRRIDDQLESGNRNSHNRYPDLHLGDCARVWWN